MPKDKATLKEYRRLIRNDALRESCANTRIWGDHFPGGERMSRTQLPSIFPWSTPSKQRGEIVKQPLTRPLHNKRKTAKATCSSSSSDTLDTNNDTHNESCNNVCGVSKTSPSQLNAEDEIQRLKTEIEKIRREQTEKEEIRIMQAEMKEKERLQMPSELDSLKKELAKLKYTLEKEPQFNIDDFKDNDADITFFYWFS